MSIRSRALYVAAATLLMGVSQWTRAAQPCGMSLSAAGSYGTGPAGASPISMAAGDFNRDGKRDVAVVNAGARTVQILLGDGTGAFTPGASYPGSIPARVGAADLNLDGKTDLVVTNEYNISLLLGNGDGTFSAAPNLASAQGPTSPVVADFNRDGKPDLAVAVYTGGNISIFPGNGNGTFQAPLVYSNPYTTKIVLGDFNRDGIPDLVSTRGFNDGTVQVWLGNGVGGLQAAASYPDTNPYVDAVAADMNGDGKADLVLSRGSYVDIRLGAGDGSFPSVSRQTLLGYHVAAADFNADGNMDLAATDSSEVHIAAGAGNGTLQTQVHIAATLANPIDVLATDVNGDGRPDVLVSNLNSDNLTVFLGTNGGTDTAAYDAPASYPVGLYPWSLAVADFNRDGRDDIVAANDGGTDLSILLANSDGLFAPSVSYALGGRPHRVISVDVNRDGSPDLALASNSELRIVLGNGDGTFRPPVAYSIGLLLGVASGDFNGDGKPDLVAAAANPGRIVLWPGNGDGSLQAAVEFPLPLTPFNVVAADFDGNGRLDVAFPVQTVNNGSYVGVMLASGPGTFAAMTSYPMPTVRQQGVAVDLNRDGRLDLAFATNDGTSVLYGAGAGTFSAAVTRSLGTSEGIVTGDWNSDGKPDLALSTCWVASVLLGNGSGGFSGNALDPGGCSHGVATGDFNGDGKPDFAVVNTNDGLVKVFLHAAPYSATVALTSPANPSLAGMPVTLTATVTSTAANCDVPAGSITFKEGATILNSVPLDGLVWASLAVSSAIGTRSFTAAYSGNRTFAAAVSPALNQAVIIAPSTTTLTTNQNPAPIGSNVTFTATVASAGLSPTGTVTFRDGATTLATVALSGGSAVFSTSSLATGPHSITASYSGGPFNAASASAGLSQSVTLRTSTTNLYTSLNPAPAGRQVTLAVSVAGYGPSGTVTFREGGTDLGTSTLNGYAWTGLTLANLAQGVHSITAVYSGDSRNLGSTSMPLSLTISAPETTCAVTFVNPVSYGTGVYTYKVASGDFNQDGRPDLAATVMSADKVSVLLGTAGGFQVAVDYAVGAGPRDVAAGDLNGDGRPDLVTANSSSVSVLLAAAGGGFLPAANIPTTGDGSPNYLVLADVNRDGKPDLVATANANVTVRLGNGDGTFQSRAAYATGAAQAAGLAAADFNNDGAPDLVAGDVLGTTVRVLLNDGAGAFPQAAGYAAGSGAGVGVGPRALAAGDFNGDGKLDLAVLNNNNHAVLLGTGGAHPNAFLAPVTYPVSNLSNPGSIVAGDFTGDGKLDFAVTYMNGHNVGVWRGDGGGAFQLAAQHSAGIQPMGLAAADLNGDGKLDLAVANVVSFDVSVLVATGGISATTVTLASAPNPSVYGSQVTLTATVSAPGGCAAPSGTVTFQDGAVTLGSATISGGSASLSTPGLNAGNHALTAVYAGGPYHTGSTSASLAQTVNKASQSIVIGELAEKTYGDAPFNALATGGASGNPVTFSASGNCSVSTSAVTLTGAGFCSITADQAGNANYEAAPSVTQTFAIAKLATQTSLGLSAVLTTYGGAVTFTAIVVPVPATGTVEFRNGQAVLGSATLSGGSAQFTTSALPAGSYMVSAVYLGDANFAGSSVPASQLTVSKASQSIAFGGLAGKTYGDAPFTVSATGGASGNPVTFSGTGNCSVSNTTVTITGAGSGSITASQAGNANYEAAPSVTQTFAIAKAAATLLLGNLSQVADGNPKPASVATTPAGLPGVAVTYDGQLNAPAAAGSYAVVASLVHADYTAAPVSGLLVIAAPTATGSTTVVSSVGSTTVSTSFSNVTQGGTTSVTPIPPLTAATTPGGFVVSGANLAFDVTTTSTFNGTIVTCFVVPSIATQIEFDALRILHRELKNGVSQLVDVTILKGASKPDFATRTLCGKTSSLSPFYLAAVSDLTAPGVTDLALSLNPLPAGSITTLTAKITDTGVPATNIALAEYSLDGGTTWQAFDAAYYADTTLAVSAQLTPAVGVYAICVRGTDAAQNEAVVCGPLLAVYDASGGFVTGGGWIQSPAGAYAADPELTGKANFGFVSKYLPGANLPSGETQFRFQAAGLDFKSTAYEWLVISGARAQFKGSGTINGDGDYRFLLTAIDGQQPGGGGVDKFRIRIWDNSGGGLIYDNQPGKPDTGDDATELGGGSIIIHR